MVDPHDLLRVARGLTAPGATDAAMRRAVSTAYYAAFHALSGACAGSLTRGVPRGEAAWLYAYRALGHDRVRREFEAEARRFKGRRPEDVPDLLLAAQSFVFLYDERLRADYDPRPNLFDAESVTDTVELAAAVIDILNGLDAAVLTALALRLLLDPKTTARAAPPMIVRIP